MPGSLPVVCSAATTTVSSPDGPRYLAIPSNAKAASLVTIDSDGRTISYVLVATPPTYSLLVIADTNLMEENLATQCSSVETR